MNEKTQSSQTVLRALRVLTAVGRLAGRRGVGLRSLVQDTGMNRTTVYRYLSTLVASGFVTQDPENGLYALGLKSLELGALFLEGIELRDIAFPILQQLTRASGETSHLGVLDGRDIVYIDKVESASNLRMASRVGARVPTYCTALGKAILAYLPEDYLNEVLDGELAAYTPSTITSQAALRETLASVRHHGYSVDNMEHEVSVRCIGAPTFDHRGHVAAAVSISGPASRLTEERIPELGSLLKDAAARISRRLGAELPHSSLMPGQVKSLEGPHDVPT